MFDMAIYRLFVCLSSIDVFLAIVGVCPSLFGNAVSYCTRCEIASQVVESPDFHFLL